ncbi:hypothetical protein O6H91_12G049000 [Diphasiastrum complanatum]|uniref:Uncharacterized protein n=1 Tax=Diphasiastrum complanatum TaxID=34168 RepID=A0ACC2C1H7_DIPCM|nr:hypothetical protein O6H91_12G049000 [Diphasiastrum complanatum]
MAWRSSQGTSRSIALLYEAALGRRPAPGSPTGSALLHRTNPSVARHQPSLLSSGASTPSSSSLFSMPPGIHRSLLSPSAAAQRSSRFTRLRREVVLLDSLLPLYSAVASARLVTKLSANVLTSPVTIQDGEDGT